MVIFWEQLSLNRLKLSSNAYFAKLKACLGSALKARARMYWARKYQTRSYSKIKTYSRCGFRLPGWRVRDIVDRMDRGHEGLTVEEFEKV